MKEPAMDAVERLTAVEEIKRLKARYLLAIDDHDWDAYAATFTPDGVLDLADEHKFHRGRPIDPGPDGPAWVAKGRSEIQDFISAALDSSVSVHEGHTPIIDITSADTATGIWGFHDFIVFPDGSSFRGYGRYLETYRRVDGEWMIASMSLSRIRVDWTSTQSVDA
jgi:SnoaL-like domain